MKEIKLLDMKPKNRLKICKHHYGIMIENMTDLFIPIKPLVTNGISGIIYDGEIIELGYPCLMCEQTGVYKEVIDD